jgi:hypothetical protein
LQENLLPVVDDVALLGEGRAYLGILVLKHVECNVVGVLRVADESIQSFLGLFEPLVGIIVRLVGHFIYHFEAVLYKVDIALEHVLNLLLLYLESGFHLLELGLQTLQQLHTPRIELPIERIDFCLVGLALVTRFHHLIHLHETLRTHLDLLQHLGLHADVMVTVVAEEGAVGADALLVINADNLQLPLVDLAQLLLLLCLLLHCVPRPLLLLVGK